MEHCGGFPLVEVEGVEAVGLHEGEVFWAFHATNVFPFEDVIQFAVAVSKHSVVDGAFVTSSMIIVLSTGVTI